MPTEDILDIRAMDMERKNLTITTAAELYASIKPIAPTITATVTEINAEKSQYRISSKADWDAVPEFDWGFIMNFAR